MSDIDKRIPLGLKSEIINYFKMNCELPMASSLISNGNEPSITAAYFQSIRKDPTVSSFNGENYSWSVQYFTTTNSGEDSMEPLIGADVIFFIEIDIPGKEKFRKGILVQSKMQKKLGNRKGLEEQVKEMENYVPNSSVVLTYSENGFRSCTGEKYLKSRQKQWTNYSEKFCDFITEEFLQCRYGVKDLYFDYSTQEAMWVDEENREIKFVPTYGASEIQIKKF